MIGGFFIAALSAQAATLNVDEATGDDAVGTPYKTIQAAITVAADGDTINVAEGTYNEQVIINGKNNLIITGAGDATIIEPTYVANTAAIMIKHSDGLTIKDLKIHTSGNEQQGIWVKGAFYDDDLAITGLTIQNTTIEVDAASGIVADASTDAAHSGWLITGNRITSGAVAMSIQDLTDSTISDNTLTAGTGTNVLWTSERWNLSNLVFSDNTVSGSGGSQVSFLTDYNQLGSNVAAENPAAETTITGVTFHGNIFSNWGTRAIRVGDAEATTPGTVTGIGLDNNIFQMTTDTAVIGGTDASSATRSSNTFNVSGAAKIQTAIDAAVLGDTINVAAGTYNESLSLNKAVTLAGSGAAMTNIKAGINGGAVITIDAVTGPMAISGFTIDADGKINESGIYIEHGSSKITIEQNDIKNFTDRGIVVNSSTDSILKNNTITGSSGDINAGIYVDDESENNSIDGNNIILPTSGAGSLYGVVFAGPNSKNNTVKNNIINGGMRALQQNNNVSGTTTFSDNAIGDITSPSYAGIEIDGGSAIISGNTLKNAVRPIEIQGAVDLTVSGNMINGATNAGINLGDYSGAADIENNTVREVVNNNGIWAQVSGTKLNIAGNIIYNISGTGSFGRGIQLKPAAKNADINGNEIYNISGYAAIIIEGDDTDGATGAKINNNYIHNNTLGAAAINAQTAEFKNNRIYDNGWGIEFGAAGAEFILTNNSIDGNDPNNNSEATDLGSSFGYLSVYKGTANAAYNWWGDADKSVFQTEITEGINLEPFYINAAKTALSDASYTDASYTSTTAGQADVTDNNVSLDEDHSLDLSGGLSSALGNSITVGGNPLDLDNFTSNDLAGVDLSIAQNIGDASITVGAAVKLSSAAAGADIIFSNANLSNISVAITDGTTVLAPAGWDGLISPPKTMTGAVGSAPSGFSVGDTKIEVGSSAGILLFDQPVKVTLTGVTGAVGYKPSGSNSWKTIDTLCASAADHSNISFPNECYFTDGSNTVIWTYHFTTFGSLTATPAPVSSGGGGGGGPLPTSNAYSDWQAQQTAAAPTPVSTSATEPAIQQQPQGQVLGEQTFADGAMIRATNGIDVYIVKYIPSTSSGQAAKKFKRLILNPSVFNSYKHLKWADVLNVDQSVIDSFITSDLVRVIGNTKVYKLNPSGDTGTKQWVKTAAAFNNRGFDWQAIYEINATDRNSYAAGANLE